MERAASAPMLPVAVAGVCTRVISRRMVALGPRAALASAAVSICSTRATCRAAAPHEHSFRALCSL